MLLSLAIAVNWTLVLGGDIMLNEVTPSADVFKGISEVVRNADLAYANLEIPLTTAAKKTLRKSAEELKARTQFILKADPRHLPFLQKAGFDTVSLANNHALDYQASGLQELVRGLEKQQIGHFGAGDDWPEARRAWVTKVGGIKVGFIAFLSFNNPSAMWKCTPATASSPGIATLTITGLPDENALPIVQGIVKRAKRDCDFLAVCLHWGIERQPQPAANQVRLGRMFIDQGADLVIGSHPHVLQPGELYKGKPIIYSLGNLISSRPGSTALYRLTYEGASLKAAEYFPAKISNCKVGLNSKLPSKDSIALTAESTFRRRYPSVDSRSLLSFKSTVK